MIPLSLSLKNFRSFKEQQVFTFPRKPGLYFMQGVNVSEPRLEANGTGKSTIWDALTWCFFGETARGLAAGDVCNWEAGKGAEVAFDFALNDDDRCIWTMTRTWSPNSWTLSHDAEYVTDERVIDLVKEKDNPALEWLGLTLTPWLHSIVMAQSEQMFLDLKRGPQAELFSDVMGLDRWIDYSGRASKKAADQDRKSREMESELSRLQGELDALGRQDFRESREGWESRRKERKATIVKDYEGRMARRKSLRQALDKALEHETASRQACASAQPDERLKGDLEILSKRIREHEWAQKDLAAAVDRNEAEIEELMASPDVCTKCGTRVSKAHIEQEREKLRDKIRALQLRRKEEAKAAEEDFALHASLEKLWDKGLSTLTACVNALRDAAGDTAAARRDYEANERELDRLEDDAERIDEEANPYDDMERKAAEDGRALRSRIEGLRERLDASGERHWLMQAWVRWFKEVRLSLIGEALTELEIEVNSCVDALGLVGWELEFRVDKEGKGGNIQRGFDCFVRSPHNERAVPWRAWSGGEAQRLRVAGTMGLSDLIRGRTGATIPLEVWDEPTDGLSKQGVRDLLECLALRAQREQRVIWLVDHQAHDFGGFAGGAVITKGRNGSVISNGYI